MSLRVPDSPRFIDPLLVRAMRENRDAWRRLLERVPMLDGRLVEVDDITTGTFAVEHGLGRTPRGFVVVDFLRPEGATGQPDVYRRVGDDLSSRSMELYSTGLYTALKIWVW